MEQTNRIQQTQKSKRKLTVWSMLWTASMAVATFGPKFIWNDEVSLTIFAVILNALLGLGLIFAHIRHINSLDELQKKIQLDAMGISLGAGVIGGLTYTLLDITNLIPMDAEIGFLVMFIGITYFVGVLIGNKRYK